jgi:hypothetical protein
MARSNSAPRTDAAILHGRPTDLDHVGMRRTFLPPRPRFCTDCAEPLARLGGRRRWWRWSTRCGGCEALLRPLVPRWSRYLLAMSVGLAAGLASREPAAVPMPPVVEAVQPARPREITKPPKTPCGARTRSGRPCKRMVDDGRRCWQHRDSGAR